MIFCWSKFHLLVFFVLMRLGYFLKTEDCLWLYFRYDARLYFTDKAQFTTKPSELASPFTPEEEEMERQCDEERYMDLNRDMAEYETYQGEDYHA